MNGILAETKRSSKVVKPVNSSGSGSNSKPFTTAKHFFVLLKKFITSSSCDTLLLLTFEFALALLWACYTFYLTNKKFPMFTSFSGNDTVEYNSSGRVQRLGFTTFALQAPATALAVHCLPKYFENLMKSDWSKVPLNTRMILLKYVNYYDQLVAARTRFSLPARLVITIETHDANSFYSKTDRQLYFSLEFGVNWFDRTGCVHKGPSSRIINK
ncbi:CMT1A duplicated region transcript 4 protein-like protein [Frankliniella fusca]|uniref:CMT1A duplicated region transcript 4 protein-like protein n=1 Tax=Frankliniella fusca TaxID=407009 RepID=A0AAE1LUW1_9NEOP|nr:CMT1A duplicated region transcript 4 protein-like protein [Frankliniella fusca]